MPAVTLRPAPNRKAICETEMPYDVLLDGEKVDEAYFNLRGYRAGIPTPGGGHLDPGEVSLAQLRRDIAHINREWAELRRTQPTLRPVKPAPKKKVRGEHNPHLTPWNGR